MPDGHLLQGGLSEEQSRFQAHKKHPWHLCTSLFGCRCCAEGMKIQLSQPGGDDVRSFRNSLHPLQWHLPKTDEASVKGALNADGRCYASFRIVHSISKAAG